ncbi:response regulator [Desulfococcaceae bacterium HSG8]|nr:response regulator [Desulfococcaceae bacterium HSG8]
MATKKELPVMIAEDEPMIRMQYETVLKEYFSNIILAEDGEQAWEIFRSVKDIPVLVTDIDMPRKDGIWLMKQVEKVNPATSIVIVSSLTSVSIHSAKETVAYLPKPVGKMFLALAVFRAYDLYPQTRWLNTLKDELKKESRDEKRIRSILADNPWSPSETAPDS